MHTFFSALLYLGMGCALISCGGGSQPGMFSSLKDAFKMEPTKVWLQKVYFEVDNKLNNDAPVAVHLLIVYDDELLKDLGKNTASQYFEKTEQIRRDNKKHIDFYTWELVPGQVLPPQQIKPDQTDGKGILVFARYQTPGDHRFSVGADREITIKLGQNDLQIVPIKNPSE